MSGWQPDEGYRQPQPYPPQYQQPEYGPQWHPERYNPEEHFRRATQERDWRPAQQARPPQRTRPLPPQAPPRRSRRWVPWAAAAAAAIVIGGAGGAYALTRPGKPLTCPQQFAAWRTGPANAIAKGPLTADLNAAQSAAKAEDIPKTNSALKAVGADAQHLEAYPMPACADPAGYWPQYLAELTAAGDNAGSSPGLAGLMTAMAPLQQLKPIEATLDAELARTAGVKSVA
jgi:hypothetical protein